VKSQFGGRPEVLTFVRHNCSGTNGHGLSATEFPYAQINVAAWQECPFDLTRVSWYRLPKPEAIGVSKNETPPPAGPGEHDTCATFPGGIRVQLRAQAKSRWLMWDTSNGRLARRTDFATPYLDHGRRTAEVWYGKPLNGWHPATSEAQ
jgi:hypothetical protein